MTAATAPSAGRPARTRSGKAKPKLDAIAADAVDMARAALEEVTEPGQVGEHLRVEATGDRIVDHVFACSVLAGEAHVADEESTAVAWVALEDLPDLGEQRVEVERALAPPGPTWFER